MAVTVRAATVADAAGIGAVHVTSWQHAYTGQLPAALLAGLSPEESTRQWTERLTRTDSPSRRAVAVDERTHTVIGFAAVGPCRDAGAAPDIGELSAIYLLPDHWGRGVGHRLHGWALDELAALGMTSAALWVLVTNGRARGFYERHGWRSDGVDQDIDKQGVVLHATRYSRAVTGQGTTTSLPRV